MVTNINESLHNILSRQNNYITNIMKALEHEETKYSLYADQIEGVIESLQNFVEACYEASR